jgi:hypothetical protein
LLLCCFCFATCEYLVFGALALLPWPGFRYVTVYGIRNYFYASTTTAKLSDEHQRAICVQRGALGSGGFHRFFPTSAARALRHGTAIYGPSADCLQQRELSTTESV